ncbi:hypothetical protein [Thermoactinospora rubra]|uniref:hypothetical protein n=1 Tax=Thermoactinospora rubra TaxID=1088767 RepID=UPI000A10BFED|nr:hypothetical protein [Thermoactinospora rubra]
MPRDLERPGRLHRTDWMALLSGLLFLTLGVLMLNGRLHDWVVLLSATVAGLGLAGLVAIVARVFRGR